MLKLVRATRLLVLHEFRRYVRIPVMTEVSIIGDGRRISATSIEMSTGGMSMKSPEDITIGANVEISFALMTLPRVVVRASCPWQIYERDRDYKGRVWPAWHCVEGPFLLREVDMVRVMGRIHAVRVYELLARGKTLTACSRNLSPSGRRTGLPGSWRIAARSTGPWDGVFDQLVKS